MYIDETQEELLYELEEGTSILVNKVDLKEQETDDYVHVTLNPEIEEVPEELEEEFENPEDVQGFVEIDHLIAPDKEEALLSEREAEESIEEKEDESAKEEDSKATKKESETEEIKDLEKREEPKESVKEEANEEPKKEQKAASTMLRSVPKEKKTSRLGHIRSSTTPLYKTIGGDSFQAGEKHTNRVYYVKTQAKYGNETYYLLSTNSKGTNTLGWIKSKDLTNLPHKYLHEKTDIMTIKGHGKGTNMAWGGSKNIVHASMAKFKGEDFHVNMTEKVGNNTWYRGKINGSGRNLWLVYSQFEELKSVESSTNRLDHIKSSTTPLYKTIGGDSFQAGEKHTNRVYYVKTQAKYGNETYYLLSTNSKGTNTLGWVKSKDLTNLPHKYLHEKTDVMTIKGHGKGTNMAWGGSKNIVHASMAKFKGEDFHVNMTEKVGNNTWYRGKINGSGRNVWLVYSQVEELKAVESSTNRLGHIKSSTTPLYKTIGGDSFQAGEKHTNRVYYVKTQAKYRNETYYLLSTNSKGTNTLGWVKSKDLTNLPHKYLHEKTDVMTIKGHGKGTNMAWGGSKNIVHASMAKFKGEDFHVNMTEKVGNNTWYRGKINGSGRNVWLNSKQTLKNIITKIDYGLSLNAAVEIQMKRSPFIMNGSHGFVAKSRVNSNLKMKAGSTNVRTMPTTVSNRDNKIIKKLQGGTKIKPIAEVGKWYAIEVGGSRKTAALPQQVEQSLDPDNHLTDEVNKFQFLDLRKRTGLTTNEMNRELRTRGILKGEGKAFREASLKHGVNEMYLIVHARLETGNGTSALSNGTHEVGLDQNGKPQLVEGAADRVRLTNIKKTYNMVGIDVIDSDPTRGGAVRAYEEGWFTPHDAIVGGAHWIKDNYIYNQYNQNTIYKMRWNPEMVNGAAWKQYATDIEWAIKQARLIHSVYNKTDQNKVLSFDRPIYK